MAEFPAYLFRMAGDPEAIRASAGKWSLFGSAAADASAQITGLDTSLFVGPEGDLFREGLNADMPRHLSRTGDAFGRVSRALTTFADTLGSLQERMRPLATRAPGLWDAVQATQGRADEAAGAALSSARAEWDACVGQANELRAQLSMAVSAAVRAINTAKDMRFKENPKWWDIGGQLTNFVRDNKDLLQQLSGALKVVSLVTGLLSFIPVLAPIMGPIALGTALLASAIDLSIYAATGVGSLRTILIDVGLNLLPGVGKLAQRGIGALRNTRVVAHASGGRTGLFSRSGALSNREVVEQGVGLPRTMETVDRYTRLAEVNFRGAPVEIVEHADDVAYLDFQRAVARTDANGCAAGSGGFPERGDPGSYARPRERPCPAVR